MRTGNIMAVCCSALDVEPAALVREAHGKRVGAPARRICAWLMANHAGMSQGEIGRTLGYADHTAINTGIKTIEEKRLADPVFAALLRSMGQRIDAIADDHGMGLADIEQMAREMVMSRRRLCDARMWEVRAIADGMLALAEVARAAVTMIRSEDEEARAALAEAILDEMSAMTGAELNTPKESDKQ